MLGSIVHLHSYLNGTFGKQTVSGSRNPDQMTRFGASDLGLYSLHMFLKKDDRLIWVNVFFRRPRGGVCAPLK